MSYEFQEIAATLKAARESKGLSQRALAEKSGVLQTRISKIESGGADFRVSTLMALARALDLELALVPRKAVSAVQSVVRAATPVAASGSPLPHPQKELEQLRQTLTAMPEIAKLTTDYAQLQRQFRDLKNFTLDKAQLDAVSELSKALKATQSDELTKTIRQAHEQFRAMRNELAHSAASLARPDAIKPAYTLDDEDSNG